MVPPPIPQLLVPAAEVRQLLRGRIELGKQQSVQAERALAQDMARLADHLEGEFRKWDRYNEVLLRRCFSDDETSEAYRHSKPIIRAYGPGDKVRAIVRRYQGAIDELEATVEILELLEEADETPPLASTQGHRDDYFARLCEMTGGRPDQIVDSREVAAALAALERPLLSS